MYDSPNGRRRLEWEKQNAAVLPGRISVLEHLFRKPSAQSTIEPKQHYTFNQLIQNPAFENNGYVEGLLDDDISLEVFA